MIRESGSTRFKSAIEVSASTAECAGGVRSSGSSRVGGQRANVESFTESQWLTLRATAPTYPF